MWVAAKIGRADVVLQLLEDGADIETKGLVRMPDFGRPFSECDSVCFATLVFVLV
jgi:hypothetical protein